MKVVILADIPDEDYKKYLGSPKRFAVGVNYLTTRSVVAAAEPLDLFIKRIGNAIINGKEK